MAEYIDKSTLLRSFAPIYEHDRYTGLTFETAKQIIADHINSLPTIDIVRCEDCKQFRQSTMYKNWGVCLLANDEGYGVCREVRKDSFCSWGERMDEAEKYGI